jgi:rubrerythrin
MASHNDITGDALVSKPINRKYAENYGKLQKDTTPNTVFKVYQCSNCYIKVSTSNGKCPLCGNSLAE